MNLANISNVMENFCNCKAIAIKEISLISEIYCLLNVSFLVKTHLKILN